MPQYMPQAPGQIMQRDAPNVANAGFNPHGASPMVGFMSSLAGAMQPQQGQPQLGAPPPVPQAQMAPSGGVHPGTPGGGMDPAAMQNMLQIYGSLQPSGQLAQQMQAAGVGTQPGQTPGLLSRFQ